MRRLSEVPCLLLQEVPEEFKQIRRGYRMIFRGSIVRCEFPERYGVLVASNEKNSAYAVFSGRSAML